MNEAYRKEPDTIYIEEIQQILEKYSIGKRPLSLLLGWGETTLTRFLDGDVPSKAYWFIKKINIDKDFLEVLTRNKEKISDIAYRKSLKKNRNNEYME